MPKERKRKNSRSKNGGFEKTAASIKTWQDEERHGTEHSTPRKKDIGWQNSTAKKRRLTWFGHVSKMGSKRLAVKMMALLYNWKEESTTKNG